MKSEGAIPVVQDLEKRTIDEAMKCQTLDRGSFGVLDSGRPDVKYEDWYGRKLDRRLLDLLMRY